MRKHRFLLAATALLAVISTAWAATNDYWKNKTLSTLEFKDAKYDGKLPEAWQPLADAIKKNSPEATFKLEDGKILLVGVNAESNMKGFKATWKSNCSVNSKFELTNVLAENEKPIENTLVAWTRIEHEGFDNAKVQKYNPATEKNHIAEVILKK